MKLALRVFGSLLIGCALCLAVAVYTQHPSVSQVLNLLTRVISIGVYLFVLVGCAELQWAFQRVGKSCVLRRSGIAIIAMWSLARIGFTVYGFDVETFNLAVGAFGGLGIGGMLQWALRQGRHAEVLPELGKRETWIRTPEETEVRSARALAKLAKSPNGNG